VAELADALDLGSSG